MIKLYKIKIKENCMTMTMLLGVLAVCAFIGLVAYLGNHNKPF